MTIEEKLKIYREKRQFIYEVSRAFVKVPGGHSVEDVLYEVFFKEYAHCTDVVEWITVQYKGGGKAHRRVDYNSNSANFKTVAAMIEGGYYEENLVYQSMDKVGYRKLDLNTMCSYKEEK